MTPSSINRHADAVARCALAAVILWLLLVPRCWRLVLIMLALVVVVFLVGCESTPRRVGDILPAVPKPVPVACEAQCLATCLPSAWPQWTADPTKPEAWDALGEQVIGPLQTIARACDAARASCVDCLRRLERVDLICGPTRACPG